MYSISSQHNQRKKQTQNTHKHNDNLREKINSFHVKFKEMNENVCCGNDSKASDSNGQVTTQDFKGAPLSEEREEERDRKKEGRKERKVTRKEGRKEGQEFTLSCLVVTEKSMTCCIIFKENLIYFFTPLASERDKNSISFHLISCICVFCEILGIADQKIRYIHL